MTRSHWIKITTAVFMAVVIMTAGCGGGGGGTTVPARTSNLNLKINLPRSASSVVINSALIEVLSIDATGAATQVAYDSPSISYNTTTYAYEGTYFIDEIPVGTNYLVKMTLNTSYVDTYTQTAARVAGQTSSATYTLYAGAIIPAIQDGVTADVTVDEESTVVAAAAIKYAVDKGSALTNSTMVSASVLSSIEAAVASLIASNQLYPYSFIGGEVDPFTEAGINALSTYIDMVLAEAQLIDTTAPTVTSFSPASGATNVIYNGTAFAAIFSESMDSTVDLNTAATLTASGFSITLSRSDTGASITIDSTNALSYGTFSWGTVTNANDKLIFTLKSSATLKAAGLSVLEAGTTYVVSTFSIPTNVTDVAGNAVSSSGLPTTGSFSTAAATSVTGFSPADGATGVDYDGTVFAVMFSQSMDSTVDLNTAATLSASGFSITVVKSDTGASLTIDSTNALSYGTFAWGTATNANDKLTYTLKSTTTLMGSGLSSLEHGATYVISSFTAPTNLLDADGNPVSTAGIASTGSFTTADTTVVTGFSPANGATGVAYDGTVFAVSFSASMDSTVDLNTAATLSASGFSITVVRSDTGASLTIDSTNALSYGTFAWVSSGTTTNDKLEYTLKSTATLEGAGLSALNPETTYTISSFTAPTNLVDASGNALDMTGVSTSGGYFVTMAVPDTTAPTVVSTTPDATAIVANTAYVPYDSPTITVLFSESMDTLSVDNAVFDVTLTRSDTGASLIIDELNVDSYGTYAWTSTNSANDTLTLTLFSNATLTANGLDSLQPSTTYTFTISVSGNATDLAGNALDTSSFPMSGSFITDSGAL